MLTLATAFLLLSAAAKPGPPPESGALPDAPSARLQNGQVPPPAAPPDHPRPRPQWLKVESLQPGDSIAVLEPGRHFPTPCRFDDVTDDTLTCTAYPLHTAPRRTVYPIHNIEAIYIDTWTDSSSTAIPLVIGGTLGGLFGGGLCKEGSAGTIAGCVVAGVGLGALIAVGVANSAPPPPHRHLSYRLIYQAP